ncbi:MAG: TolC family protein [Bacteroidota bacterium]|nr:TolC family protein [Bacteroidota bacterium]
MKQLYLYIKYWRDRNSVPLCLRVEKIVLVAILVCVLKPGYSQDSINNYLMIAAKNNPSLKASYNEYLASLEMVPQVGALPDPDVTFGYFIKPKEELMGKQVADIRFMQMFPWFGTLKASKTEATSMAQARFEAFAEARNRLYFEVKSAWYQLYKLNKEKALAEKNLKFLKTFEQLALVRFKTGGNASSGSQRFSSGISQPDQSSPSKSGMGGTSMGSGSAVNAGGASMPVSGGSMTQQGKGMVDVLRVQMDIRELETSIESLNDKKIPLEAAFNSLLNRPQNFPVLVPDSLIASDFIADFKLLSDSISAHNPMIKMYKSEQASYEAKADKARRMGYPMVGVGFDYMVLKPKEGADIMDNGKDMVMPMVTITLPIYRKKYNAMRREADLQQSASREKQTAMLNDLQVNLQNLLLDVKNARRKTEQYQWQIKLTNQSLDILAATYQSGGADLEEVLQMQQKRLELEFKLVESMVDQLTAVANVEYLMAKSNY